MNKQSEDLTNAGEQAVTTGQRQDDFVDPVRSHLSNAPDNSPHHQAHNHSIVNVVDRRTIDALPLRSMSSSTAVIVRDLSFNRQIAETIQNEL